MLNTASFAELTLLGTPNVDPVQPEQIVLAKTKISIESNDYISQLVVINQKTKDEQLLWVAEDQDSNWNDVSPKWSPNGEKLAFIRKIQGRDELHIYDRTTKQVRALASQYKVKDYVWSPDSEHIVFISRVNDVNPIAYKVKRMRFKLDGEGMTNGYNHIFLVDVASAEVRQLTFDDSDHSNPTFTADHQYLYYSMDYAAGNDLDKNPVIHKLDLQSRQVTVLQPEVKSITTLFVWKKPFLLGIGKQNISSSTEYDKWFIYNEEQSKTEWFIHQPEVHIGYHLISDSKRSGLTDIAAATNDDDIFVYAGTNQGKQSLYLLHVALQNERVEANFNEIRTELNVINFAVQACTDQACHIVLTGDSMNQPCELYHLRWNYEKGRQTSCEASVSALTACNKTASTSPIQINSYTYVTKDELQIQGWSMQLADQEQRANATYKGTMLWIHGGPHLAYGECYHHEFRYWANLGYRLVFCNPRGSSGYGQSFAYEIIGQWGNKDVDDIMGFLDVVLTNEGIAEHEPLYLLGGSYGGYLVNWIIGHDHRFKAAVTERSICNLYSKIGNSDIGFQNNIHQLGGHVDLWTDEQYIMERSPISYAPEVTTPVLIIHAEQDHRCPIEQGEQWYSALHRLGKEVEFIRFPGASHALATTGKPKQRIARLEGIREWLARY